MSSDNWINTTFYNQDATNLPSGLLNTDIASSSLKPNDYQDTSYFEKGMYFALPIGGDKTMIPEKPGCSTEWKWDWKCGSSDIINSSNPHPLKPTGSNPTMFDDTTSTPIVLDDSILDWWWNISDIFSRGKPQPMYVPMDCINQSRSCSVRLHLDDFGILTIKRLKSGKDEDEILWRSHTATSSQLPESAIPHDYYIPSNTSEQNIGRPRKFTGREMMGLTKEASGILSSRVYSFSNSQYTNNTPSDQKAIDDSVKDAENNGRSFLFANEKINKGEWLSSPNGMCRLTLNNHNELAVEYYESKCTDLKSTDVSEVHVMNIIENPTSIGKMGYIDGSGILHEWPVAPATGEKRFGSTYWGVRNNEEPEYVNKYTYFDGFVLGNTNSLPNQTTTASNMSDCEKWCTSDKLCAAYSFNDMSPPDSKCNIVSLPNGATTLDMVYTDGGKYAVRSKKIVGGDSSVPIDVYPINTVSNRFWNMYSKDKENKGDDMTESDKGGLSAATAPQQYARNVNESFVDSYTPSNPFVNSELKGAIEYNRIHNSDIVARDLNSLNTGYGNQSNTYNSSIGELKKTQTNIQSNLDEYGNVQKQLNNMDPEVTKQLSAMDEEKRLNLNSIKMRYLLWGILLIVLLIVVVFMFMWRSKAIINEPTSS